jgi:hypothetical protein
MSDEHRIPDGKGVDRSGGAVVVDPTKNVLDLVNAESKKRDEFRVVDAELIEAKIKHLQAEQRVLQATTDGQANLQNWMRDSESKRLDQLSSLRETYEKRIADMLSESVRSTSALVSTQLLQIQSTFDARVSKLEEFRLLSTGRSSVADPALAEAMHQMVTSITALKESGKATEGRGIAVREVVGWVFGAIGAVALIVTAVYTIHQPTIQYVSAPTAAVPSTTQAAPITVPR